MKRQIFAISGGGFSNEENSPLDQYLVELVPKETVNICFIPTASQDAAGYIEKFYKAFPHEHTSHITIEQMQKQDMTQFLLQQHIVYVGGGVTKNMLTIWRDTKFDRWIENYPDLKALHFVNEQLVKYVMWNRSSPRKNIRPLRLLALFFDLLA